MNDIPWWWMMYHDQFSILNTQLFGAQYSMFNTQYSTLNISIQRLILNTECPTLNLQYLIIKTKNSIFNTQSTLNNLYFALKTEQILLDTKYFTPKSYCWTLYTQHSLNTQHSILNTQSLINNTQYSTLNTQIINTQYSTLNTQHLTLNGPQSLVYMSNKGRRNGVSLYIYCYIVLCSIVRRPLSLDKAVRRVVLSAPSLFPSPYRTQKFSVCAVS